MRTIDGSIDRSLFSSFIPRRFSRARAVLMIHERRMRNSFSSRARVVVVECRAPRTSIAPYHIAERDEKYVLYSVCKIMRTPSGSPRRRSIRHVSTQSASGSNVCLSVMGPCLESVFTVRVIEKKTKERCPVHTVCTGHHRGPLRDTFGHIQAVIITLLFCFITSPRRHRNIHSSQPHGIS